MVTTDRDLRTGRSVWEGRHADKIPHGPLARNLQTDVVVIGAGITGAMIADALADAGLRVIVLDRRDDPVKGSTVASTALVQYEVDTPLSMLKGKIGADNAVRAWRRSRLAVESIAARLGELKVPDVVRRDSLYLAGDALDAEGLEKEGAAREDAGIVTRFLTRKALKERFGIARQAALLGYGNLAIDPRKTALALLAAAVSNGAKVFAPVTVEDVDCRARGATIHTNNGKRIDCSNVVFATGYEQPDSVPMRGHKIISTFAIATVPQKRKLWPEQCLIWEASEPYLYLRTTPEGRVICGGEDEEFSDEDKRDAMLARKTQTLRNKLRKMFPELSTTIDFAWTGSFGQSSTGLPRIGAIPGMKHCFAALGYGGNGITYSRISAEIITGALTGRRDVDADLYDFEAKK